MKGIYKFLLGIVVFFLSTILVINSWVLYTTEDKIVSSIAALTHYQIGLVLGTSKYSRKGKINPFYQGRIQSTIELFNSHKIKDILVSGDNRFNSYNEPIMMWRDLRSADIPNDKITLDYAGFRTLDSVIRARKIFDVNKMLIITQGFHCPRALYIAHYYHITAQCYAAPPTTISFNLQLREVLARILTFIDLYITHKEPYFLGKKEPIISNHPVEK